MSVKTKLIIAAAAVMGVSSAYAGGPEMMAAPAAPSFTPFFYAEAGLGYAQTGYEDFYDINSFNVAGASVTDTDNTKGGMTYLGDFGYQFMPNLAVELGGGYLPEAKGTLNLPDDNTATTDSYKAKLKSWFAYGAARMNVSLMNDKTSLYGKAGLAYRNMKGEVADQSGSESFFAPFFGTGLSYSIRDNIYVAAEYDHIGGTNDLETITVQNAAASVDVAAPDVNLFVGKIGYKFSF